MFILLLHECINPFSFYSCLNSCLFFFNLNFSSFHLIYSQFFFSFLDLPRSSIINEKNSYLLNAIRRQATKASKFFPHMQWIVKLYKHIQARLDCMHRIENENKKDPFWYQFYSRSLCISKELFLFIVSTNNNKNNNKSIRNGNKNWIKAGRMRANSTKITFIEIKYSSMSAICEQVLFLLLF